MPGGHVRGPGQPKVNGLNVNAVLWVTFDASSLYWWNIRRVGCTDSGLLTLPLTPPVQAPVKLFLKICVNF